MKPQNKLKLYSVIALGAACSLVAFFSIESLSTRMGGEKSDKNGDKNDANVAGVEDSNNVGHGRRDRRQSGNVTRVSPSELERLVHRFKELGKSSRVGTNKGTTEMGELFTILVKNMGFDECSDLIREAVGDGSDSDLLFGALFEMSPEGFDSLFKRLDGLNGKQQEMAIAALWQVHCLSAENWESGIKLLAKAAGMEPGSKILPLMMMGAMAAKAGDGGTSAYFASLEKSIEGFPEEQKKLILAEAARAASRYEPFESWKMASRIGDEVAANKIRETCLATMMQKDPLKALDAAAATPATSELLATAYQIMLRQNPKIAENWLSENRNRLDDKSMDLVKGAEVLNNLRNLAQIPANKDGSKDFTGLWSDLAEISDPATRDRIQSRLWKENLDAVRKQMAKDPEGTLNNMVAGTSGSPDALIEESAFMWMQQDRKGCGSWYDKHWSKMPKDKLQYLAAAMARYATGANDIESARSWLPFIKDPAMKGRIEGLVNQGKNGN